MRAIENINLEELTAEQLDQVVGDHFKMPDGSKIYIELTLLHWYWIERHEKRGTSAGELIANLLDYFEDNQIEYEPEFFCEAFRQRLIAGGQGTIRSEQQGIPPTP